MDILTVFERFPTHEACIDHLELVRWGDSPECPYCGKHDVAPKADGDRVGRWNCHNCGSSFNVLAGTIFQGTHTPLQKWFLAISLMLNAKKSLSSCQLARDTGLDQSTALRIQRKIRQNMVTDSALLTGIVEADETYIGGKPRKGANAKPKGKNPTGRGTKKLPVVGAVERNGTVHAEPSPRVTAKTLKAFLMRRVSPDALLMTDAFRGYSRMGDWIRHATIDHAKGYAEGIIHVNSIESFWALLKRALFGSHHHYTVKHAAEYIAEACYKYNIRRNDNPFGDFIQAAVA